MTGGTAKGAQGRHFSRLSPSAVTRSGRVGRRVLLPVQRTSARWYLMSQNRGCSDALAESSATER